jgi:hypothetical protein
MQTSGPGHTDRCWLSTEQKRVLREVTPGEVGLVSKLAERGAA